MANDHVKMFTEEYSPIAVQVGKQIGVSPTVLLAQWGMETDYGRKVPGHFNLGNIKDMSGSGTSAVDNKSKTKDNYVNFESPEAFGDYYAT
jgi:flagellum-specific peptidoglycan hydrolase FlgJ